MSNLPPATEEETREAFLTRVEEFEAANPDIDVEPSEYEWDVATFAAQMAGGTLPTVFQIPFPDSRGLVERGEVADITAQFEALPYAGDFNPNVLAVAQDAEGKVYGVPFAAYGIGLHYNRAMFEEAGLDPDAPADELGTRSASTPSRSPTPPARRATPDDAEQHRRLDAHGAVVRQRRAACRRASATTTTATLDNPGTVAALELLKAMRWEDNSMGSNFLLDWGTINQAFAAGQVGDVHVRLGRLQQPRHRERDRPGHLRADDPAPRRRRRRRCSAAAPWPPSEPTPPTPRRRPASSGSTSSTCRS